MKAHYGQSPPLAAINYIWESLSPQGIMVPNPFTDRVIMFVVESGEEKLNQWVSEERNVYEDYKRASPDLRSGHHDRHRQHRGVGGGLLWGHCLQEGGVTPS